MFWVLLKTVILTLSLQTALANSPPAEGKEGGGEGEGAPKEAAKKDEYAEYQGRVAALEAKIAASEDIIKRLLADKQSTKNQEQVSEIVKSLVAEHKTLQKNIEDYDQARSYLRYRFPEKGLKETRVYERIELKSLEEMESQLSLDARVKKTLVKVRKQYPGSETKKPVASPEEDVAQTESHEHGTIPVKKSGRKKQEGPGLADPVILTK